MRSLPLLPIILILSSCAVTGVTRSERIDLVPANDRSKVVPAELGINCPGIVDSVMISPVIPLPPIIPIGFLSEDVVIVVMKTPHESSAVAKIFDIEREEIDIPITTSIWVGNKYGKSKDKSWAFKVESTCKDLDNLILQIEIVTDSNQTSLYEYKMKYKVGDFNLESGYISA